MPLILMATTQTVWAMLDNCFIHHVEGVTELIYTGVKKAPQWDCTSRNMVVGSEQSESTLVMEANAGVNAETLVWQHFHPCSPVVVNIR